jgi:hypothetical protein
MQRAIVVVAAALFLATASAQAPTVAQGPDVCAKPTANNTKPDAPQCVRGSDVTTAENRTALSYAEVLYRMVAAEKKARWADSVISCFKGWQGNSVVWRNVDWRCLKAKLTAEYPRYTPSKSGGYGTSWIAETVSFACPPPPRAALAARWIHLGVRVL